MKLLLDTCTFLWLIDGDSELSSHAQESIISPENEVYLSAISVWEIALKYQMKKLKLSEEPSLLIPSERERHGIALLVLDEEAALQAGRLPFYHQDPFDRMLIAQAIVSGSVLITPDKLIRQYPIKTDW